MSGCPDERQAGGGKTPSSPAAPDSRPLHSMGFTLPLPALLLLAPLMVFAAPIGLHPPTPLLFTYHGKPLVPITATEHYDTLIPQPFRLEPDLSFLCTLSDVPDSIDAAVQVLFGELTPQSQLPVCISDSYPRGHRVNRNKTP